MATSKKSAGELEQLASNVKLKLLDPLGNAIDGLKYQIRQGGRIVAQGVTDGQGRLQQFASHLGKELSVQVEHFTTGAMTEIHALTPWNEKMSLKLVSGKVKHKAKLAQDKGTPGAYRRRTHTVASGDTLTAIAAKHGTSAQAIATLNDIALGSTLHIGQVLKLPATKGAASSGASAPAATPAAVAAHASAPVAATPAASSQTAAPPAAPTTTVPAGPATAPANIPPVAKVVDGRGENGTPKTAVEVKCDQQACIKLGDKGPLIEELNIRLMGFGNTISAPTPLNEFTAKTERAVKQFQRDYMGVAETGKVCGPFLAALDDFLAKYPVSLGSMKCRCGKCEGFGNGQLNSKKAGVFTDTKQISPRPGVEYPGMHRALLWGFRAALYYAHVKDKALTFKFQHVSSGYRCWFDNAGYLGGVANNKTKRNSTNHMGNALDLQWTKGKSTTRCAGADVDEIRTEIFVKRLGAQMRWPGKNKLSLEAASDGATSWVHVDVREFESQYKDTRFYAVTQAGVDGDRLVEMARREGRLALVACGGLPLSAAAKSSAPAPVAGAQRILIDALSVSSKGVDFIKGWERLGLKPYDDSEGYCTVGWGHLIAKKSCASLADDPGLKPFKGGITRAAADAMMRDDIQQTEDIVKARVQVPMFQQEYDALVSLIFNLGGFSKCPKLLSKLNTRDYSGCCDEFADITNGGTSGLVKRRQAEMNIFRNNVYDSAH